MTKHQQNFFKQQWTLLFVLLFGLVPACAKEVISIKDNPIQYATVYIDPESKLQYLNARYYDPEDLRFISRDSYRLDNRYTYAAGNPIINTDPSGHEAKDVASWINYAANIFMVSDAYAIYKARMNAPTALAGFSILSFVMADVLTAVANANNNTDARTAAHVLVGMGTVTAFVAAAWAWKVTKDPESAYLFGKSNSNTSVDYQTLKSTPTPEGTGCWPFCLKKESIKPPAWGVEEQPKNVVPKQEASKAIKEDSSESSSSEDEFGSEKVAGFVTVDIEY